MNKRGMEIVFQHIIALVIIIVGLLIILTAQGEFQELFQNLGKKQACILNIQAMQIFKNSLGGQPWQPNCEIKRVTITEEDVSDTSAVHAMEKYNTVDWPPIGYDHRNYNMDRIVADQLKYAWDIVSKGDREYFSEWWTFLRCEAGDFPSPSGTIDCENAPDTQWWELWEKEHPSFVTMCMVLGRVKFEPEVQDMFKGETFDTLNEFMNNNPVDRFTMSNIYTGSLMSYTEYLRTDNEGFSASGQLLGEDFKYTVDKPYVIVYLEPKHHATRPITKPLEWLRFREPDYEKPINTVRLIPLEETNQYCDYVLGYLPE